MLKSGAPDCCPDLVLAPTFLKLCEAQTFLEVILAVSGEKSLPSKSGGFSLCPSFDHHILQLLLSDTSTLSSTQEYKYQKQWLPLPLSSISDPTPRSKARPFPEVSRAEQSKAKQSKAKQSKRVRSIEVA